MVMSWQVWADTIPFTQTQLLNGNVTVSIGYLLPGQQWQFEYGVNGFVPGTGTIVLCGSTTTKTIRLNPFTSWDFRVQKTTYQSSGWSQIQSIDNSCVNSSNYVGVTDDFNNPVSTCWRAYKISSTNQTSSDATVFNQNYDGTPGTCINLFSQSNYGVILVSPRLEDLSTDKKLKFWLKATQTGTPISVGTIENPYDPSTYHEISTFTSSTTDFLEKTLFLNNFNGTDKYIAFRYRMPTSYGNYMIDQISYEQSVNCFDISNVTFTNINETSAQINFDAPGQNSWELSVKNVLTGQTQVSTINQNPYVLQNLSGNTNYQIKLRASCDVGLFSNWTPLFQFSTPCTTITNEYHTGFDEFSYLNPCWSKIESNTFYNVSLNNSPFANSPSKIINFIGGYNTSYNTILVSPFIETISNDKRVRFYLHDNKRNPFLIHSFVIGTILNPNDASTFVPIKTLLPEEINPIGIYEFDSLWQQFIIDFTNYQSANNHHHIALKINHSTNSNTSQTISLDDFYFEDMPSCKEPTNLQVLNYEHNWVSVSWNNENNASAWQIEYGPTGFTHGNGTIVDSNSPNYTINSNLIDNTEYDYYVRTVCQNGTSQWSGKGYFKTRCSGVLPNYSTSFDTETFEENSTCWRRLTPLIRNSYWGPNYFIDMYSNGQFAGLQTHSGANLICMRGGADSPETNEQNKTILVTPRLIGFDNAKEISFWAYCPNNAYSTLQSIVIGTLSNPNDYNSFEPYQSISGPFTSNQWIKHTVDFSGYSGTNQYIGIKQISSNGSYYLCIDDFEYKENPCRRPTNLSAFQSSQLGATLSWDSNVSVDGNSSWEIEYGELGFVPGTGTITTSTTNPFVLTNLQLNKKYQFRVRNVCSNNFVNWSELYSFKITCLVNAPFSENFDQYQTYNYPDLCWTSNNLITAGLTAYSSNNITSAPNAAFVESNPYQSFTNGTFISPYLADFDHTKRIKFWAYIPINPTGYVINLIVGTMKNPLDLSTFEPFQSFTMNSSILAGNEFTVDFTNYTGTNKHIAFRTVGYDAENFLSNRILIDDIFYDYIPNCYEPVDIKFHNVNNNSTLLQWVSNSPFENIEIEYGPTGFSPGNGTVVTTNQNEINITGLQESTTYDFYFRTICSNSNSLLVGPKKLTTSCNLFSIPWTESLNNSSQYGLNALPDCFKKTTSEDITFMNSPMDISSYNTSYSPDGILNGYNDSTYINVNNGFYTSIYTPMFHLEAGTTYKYSMHTRKAYEFDFTTIRLDVIRGHEIYNKIATTPSIGTISEYHYNKLDFFYTPIETGDYSLGMLFTDSGSLWVIADEFSLDEGYDDLINSDRLYNFDNTNNDELILEETKDSSIEIINLENNALKLSGNSTTNFNPIGDQWLNNQNSITKVNFKIDNASFPSLFLSFKLKQTYTQNNSDSAFKVLVNGNQIGDIIYPTTQNQDIFETHQFDLSSYLGSDLKISLQHFGKSITGNGDTAYLDDIIINPSPILNSNDIEEIFNLKVYPNPSKNNVNIISDDVITAITVTNISGQKLLETNTSSNHVLLDLKEYPDGIYFVNVQSEQKSKTVKIIKN